MKRRKKRKKGEGEKGKQRAARPSQGEKTEEKRS